MWLLIPPFCWGPLNTHPGYQIPVPACPPVTLLQHDAAAPTSSAKSAEAPRRESRGPLPLSLTAQTQPVSRPCSAVFQTRSLGTHAAPTASTPPETTQVPLGPDPPRAGAAFQERSLQRLCPAQSEPQAPASSPPPPGPSLKPPAVLAGPTQSPCSNRGLSLEHPLRRHPTRLHPRACHLPKATFSTETVTT